MVEQLLNTYRQLQDRYETVDNTAINNREGRLSRIDDAIVAIGCLVSSGASKTLHTVDVNNLCERINKELLNK